MGSNFFQHWCVGEIRAGLINYITMQQSRFCMDAALLLSGLLKICLLDEIVYLKSSLIQ